jgi:1,4-alpha-glucan branching enzyme
MRFIGGRWTRIHVLDNLNIGVVGARTKYLPTRHRSDPNPVSPNRIPKEQAAPAKALAEGRCAAPFEVLGPHPTPDGGYVLRAFIPWARSITVLADGRREPMERLGSEGLFQAEFPDTDGPFPYRLLVEDPDGREWEREDPYRFAPSLDEERLEAFHQGRERYLHELLGALPMGHQDVDGTRFTVWAPNAAAVSITGDMNGWDARCHPMRRLGDSGVWELFVPNVGSAARYKYEVVTAAGEHTQRADPCGRAAELRPATASEVWHQGVYEWGDDAWMERRRSWGADTEPVTVYELHLGSWRRPAQDDQEHWLGYRRLADELLPYVADMGFTHLELLPILEHPLDQSWGYQPLGFFAPTSRYGNPDDFRYFVDRAHQLGLGVLLDWVPGHFPSDAHGLALFDGTPLYEDPDPEQARHPDWGTLVFDFGKPMVRSFLISSAIHWLRDYHLDGLRVDAVASMLYLDYSRPEGTWKPNELGGNENLHAVSFLKELNDAVHQEEPGVIVVAEESTAWPRVSHGTDRDGLGFDEKWNMGWMNDTLDLMHMDYDERTRNYEKLTFAIAYAFSERFVLPLSHDEVVHGKSSLIGKMPGTREEKFANLRLLYAYMWTHPGKKLLFMGGELAQWDEWNADAELDWALDEFPPHRGVRDLVRDLNRLYRQEPALHVLDHQPEGFEWLDCHDTERGTLSYVRWAPEWSDAMAIAINFKPEPLEAFRLALPKPGPWQVVLSTADPAYGGSGFELPETLEATDEALHGRPHSVALPLPGLATVVLKPR